MAQANSLSEAWHYSPNDHFLHVLPLHHIHGTVNALLTPLLAGSTIEFLFPFTVDSVWSRLAAPFLPATSEPIKKPITFFTVVPTIYNRLLQSHNTLSPEMQKATKEALDPKNMRLNISGSAALPTPTKQAWTELSNGNVLLERYGMTEVGMALSCGLANEDRVDGSVGWPLPSVEARLVDLDTKTVIKPGEELDTDGKERSGEIQLRGPTIFKEYWNNPTATAKEFTEDGFFKTGDVAVRRNVSSAGKGASGEWAQGSMYFILGRLSADIIKVGGEKVSALEVEREMLSLPAISECAVVGLPSEIWGQKPAAVVVLSEQGKTGGKYGKPFGAMDLRRGLKDKMAAFKVPQELKVVESIPRNAMGKSKFLVSFHKMYLLICFCVQSTRNSWSSRSLDLKVRGRCLAAPQNTRSLASQATKSRKARWSIKVSSFWIEKTNPRNPNAASSSSSPSLCNVHSQSLSFLHISLLASCHCSPNQRSFKPRRPRQRLRS